MSGLEVAGIVLAVIPLVIELADRWKEASKRLDFLLDFKDQIKKCRQDVGYHDCTFKQNLKRLLRPVFHEDEQVAKLLEDPTGSGWKDAEIKARLENRLQESYWPYMNTLARYDELMSELKVHLGMNIETIETYIADNGASEQKSVKVFSRQFRRRAWKRTQETAEVANFRTKFANREKERKELIEELETCNSRLARLLDDCDKDNEITRERSRTNPNKALCGFWKRAKSFFDALQAAWGCCCWQEHTASLLLTHRAGEKSISATEFRIVFMARMPAPWHVRYTRIVESRRHEAAMPALGGQTEPSSISQPKHRLVLPPQPASGAKSTKTKAVSFDTSKLPSVTVTSVEPESQEATIRAIKSLCTTFIEFPHSCGYICDDCDRRYFISPDSGAVSPPTTATMESITLEQLIRIEPAPRLKKRLILAQTLASSFVQLAESPWLPRNWTKADIIFYADPSKPGTYQLDKPHIRRDFEVKGDHSIPLQTALDTLGVVLWEIGYGAPVDISKWQSLLPGGASSDDRGKIEFLAARERVGELADEVGNLYASAVEWSLNAGVALAAGQSEWRKLALDNIVLRLDECLNRFTAVAYNT